MIKLEMLDYVYSDGGQNQVNFNNVTNEGNWNVIN